MSPEVQGVVAVAIVAGAALYAVRRAWSSWRAARPVATGEHPRGCGSGGDCH